MSESGQATEPGGQRFDHTGTPGDPVSQPAPGRVVVRGPQVAPTVAEVLGDPRKGHIQERHRATEARTLRKRQIRGNLWGVLLLITILASMWLLAHMVALITVVLVYPCMAALALWMLHRARRMESP